MKVPCQAPHRAVRRNNSAPARAQGWAHWNRHRAVSPGTIAFARPLPPPTRTHPLPVCLTAPGTMFSFGSRGYVLASTEERRGLTGVCTGTAIEPLVGLESDALWFLRSPGEQPPSTALDTCREEMIERVPYACGGGIGEHGGNPHARPVAPRLMA